MLVQSVDELFADLRIELVGTVRNLTTPDPMKITDRRAQQRRLGERCERRTVSYLADQPIDRLSIHRRVSGERQGTMPVLHELLNVTRRHLPNRSPDRPEQLSPYRVLNCCRSARHDQLSFVFLEEGQIFADTLGERLSVFTRHLVDPVQENECSLFLEKSSTPRPRPCPAPPRRSAWAAPRASAAGRR